MFRNHAFRLSLLAIGLLTLSAVRVAEANPADHTTSAVHLFSDGSAVAGAWSTLVRNQAGVSMTIHTTGLTARDAVTVWWVVFNNPSACASGVPGIARCGEGDLFAAAVNASVLYATGHVIGGHGIGDYGAHLALGDASGALFGPGLVDPLGADIHLVVRTHGPASPGVVDDQIHSFDVCNLICTDLQFAVHEP